MSDSDLRAAELAAQMEPGDEMARYRLRLARLRAGLRVKPEPGDIITVRELPGGAWIHGAWLGVYVRSGGGSRGLCAECSREHRGVCDHDAYVRPVNPDACRWRVRATGEYLAGGVYLTGDDMRQSSVFELRMPAELR